MPELSEGEDLRSIKARGLRLVFRWTGARWEHWLDHQPDDRSRPRVLAVSVEDDPTRADPARVVSPAFQQLHFQAEGPAIRALLVGQSGPHHFSAVFTVEEQDAGHVSIRVDVADRCRAPIEILASTYIVDARSGELREASPSLAAWDLGPDLGCLTFFAGKPAQVALAEAGRAATQIQAYDGPEANSATHRLFYQWHWLPDPIR